MHSTTVNASLYILAYLSTNSPTSFPFTFPLYSSTCSKQGIPFSSTPSTSIICIAVESSPDPEDGSHAHMYLCPGIGSFHIQVSFTKVSINFQSSVILITLLFICFSITSTGTTLSEEP